MKSLIFLVIIFSLLSSGCIPLLVGAGAVGGYAVSNDSARGNVGVSYNELWSECLVVLEDEAAQISESNESKGLIKAKIDSYDVTVKIDSIVPDLQKLKVSARRNLLPKPQFAQDIFFKIVKDLE